MDTPTQPKKSYKSTLNLPKTSFPMKANLVQNEPASQKRWEKIGLYEKIRHSRDGGPKYTFHDGPPYANGAIHLGHLLNKVLKDLVVRTKTMLGFDCAYIPGWDCHGLPIEHKVMSDLGDKARDMNPMQIRHRCKAAAEKFVQLQSKQMKRLLTLADYDHPYLTMTPDYEAAVLEVFADLVEKGLVYRALKPVHWSIAHQTALADAELEYYDREDTSVYVMFEVADRKPFEDHINLEPPDPTLPIYLVIWTTTPWTLPANMAVAMARNAEYLIHRVNHKDADCYVVMARTDDEGVLQAPGWADRKQVGSITGQEFNHVRYHHPLFERLCPTVEADYVSLEDGTGLVHTAPGHGVEDYQTGLRYGLKLSKGGKSVEVTNNLGDGQPAQRPDIYCPVKADGTFDKSVPIWLRGKDIWTANNLIIDHLRQAGRLFHSNTIKHSYPHDWRSKTPVIFRATEQWFISMDGSIPPRQPLRLRQEALDATARDVQFIPEWGRNRIRGMLESRPDWCISRQRAWGLPIPAFIDEDGDELLTKQSVLKVAQKIREHGSDYWFKAPPEQLLDGYEPETEVDEAYCPSLTRDELKLLQKSHDIFDVWFESGSSWNAVLRQRGFDYPADLYLEGSDQHRGWFQLSLLPALGATGKSPFKTVLTHGFMVDRDGKKMSKSGGNALEVETLLKDFGADVCRWWVAGLNCDNDIKVDLDFFKTAGEEYRKVRNTIRFLLSNLPPRNPRPREISDRDSAGELSGDSYQFTDADASSTDAWALGELDKLIADVREGYESLRFRKAHSAIFRFCNETMSAVYLAAVKDRLYCDKPDSPRRLRTQSAMFKITDALIRLIAPILPHTADEAWLVLYPPENDSAADPDITVHLEMLPEPRKVVVDPRWERVIRRREDWLKAIEKVRNDSDLDNPLDCGLTVPAGSFEDPSHPGLGQINLVDCADLCGISRFAVSENVSEIQVNDLRKEPRCERSWKRDGTVKQRSDGGMLSDRDAEALGVV